MKYSDKWARLGRTLYRLLGWAARVHLSRTRRGYLLIESSGEVLLIKNWFGQQVWHLPGGGIKKNETTAAAAVRETSEELGFWVELGGLSRLSSGRWQSEGKQFDYEIFYTALPTRPICKLKQPEILEAGWFGLGQLKNLNLPPEIKQAVAKLGQQRRKRPASGKI